MIRFTFRAYQDILAGRGIGRLPGVPALTRAVASATGANALGRWAVMRSPVSFEGFRLYLDPRSTSAPLSGKGFNRKEAEYVRGALQPGDVAVDVGANIGFFSVLFGTLVGPEGSVVAFEPVPENLSVLKRNLSLNALGNVAIVEAACGRTNGVTAMQMGRNFSTARMAGEGRSVSLTTIDSVMSAEARPVRFMKIDIEGAELFALEGSIETIARSPDIELILEYNESAFLHYGYTGANVLDFMASRGFRSTDVRSGQPFAGSAGTTNLLFSRR